MPRPSMYLPVPERPLALRLDVDPGSGPGLRSLAHECGVSLSSALRVAVEMLAAGRPVTRRTLAAEVSRRQRQPAAA